MSRKRRDRRRVLFFLLLSAMMVFACVAALLLTGRKREEYWRFAESDRSLANPDRGFYIQVKSSRPDKIAKAGEEVRVILLAFDIEASAGEELPAEKLEELKTALDAAEREKLAVVFRAAYGFHRDVTEPDRIERIGRHIEQISEVLNAYPRQILTVQAGMLGAYGEWHSSRYLEGEEEVRRESRLYVLRQWDRYLDAGIRVAVRRPRFVREAMEAGILTDRLGIHNDALLSTDDDMGTYDDPRMGRAEELQWVQEQLAGQVNGGEMPTPGMRSAPEQADREFAQLHISYLNLKYNKEIIAAWSDRTMEGQDVSARQYLGDHLGYRLFVSELAVSSPYFTGAFFREGVRIRISLCNSGYAPLQDKYRVFVTLEAGGERSCSEVAIPELYRISGGQSVTKEIDVRIPDELIEEFIQEDNAVRIGLKIAPDAAATDGRECVELANEGLVYEQGSNLLLSVRREKGFPVGLKKLKTECCLTNLEIQDKITKNKLELF